MKKIKIENKGHYELDTPERLQAFQQNLSEGWSQKDYIQYREDWIKLPKKKIIREYPPQVDIELASACNLKCPMCYTITDEFKSNVKTMFMDFKVYKKIVDEISDKVYALRLSWRGESTLHPKFIEAIAYAKHKGIKEVSFLTNGSKLKLDFFIELVNAGIDWISISVDGLDEIYNKIRKPLKSEDTLQKITDMYNYKVTHNLKKPVIKIQSIWPAIKANPENFYNTYAPITDLIAFNPIIDYLGNDQNIVYEDNFSCPQLYQRIFIASNGLVYMCNSDELGKHQIGNIKNETVYTIWHGKELSKMRDIHAQENGFMQLDICKSCFYPRATEKNESANVNGRQILIENYINRSQIIGK
ncbi:MAG: radical SAM/SPASM domain-containing protein [Arcobacteraceae bacterium]